jgi:SPX domain protein involved in polyphosphate accumulation|tara:strand:- start:2479 stop:3216 length:738 start_codon:yes stop_codon:yes gene_type:complete
MTQDISPAVVKRQELKYFFKSTDKKIVNDSLQVTLLSDPNNGSDNGYKISSLYFDNLNNDDFNQKLDGIMHREKYRLRIYNDDFTHGKFEVKRKFNNFVQKVSLSVSGVDMDKIISGDYSPISHHKDFEYVAEKMNFMAYRPISIVNYYRRAYFLPYDNIRVTIDSNLSSSGFGTNLGRLDTLINTPIQKNGYEILEVKFENDFPYFLSTILEGMPIVRSSISKYALARLENNTEISGDEPLIPF